MRGRYQRRSTASRGRYWIASLLMLSAQSGSAQGPVVLAPLPLQPREGKAAAIAQPNPFCVTSEVSETEPIDKSTDPGQVPRNHPRALVKRAAGKLPIQVETAQAGQSSGYSVSLAWTKPKPVELTSEVLPREGYAPAGPQLSEGTNDIEAQEDGTEAQPADAEDSLDLVFSDAVQTTIAEEDLVIPVPTAKPVVGVAIAPQLDDLQAENSKRTWKGDAPVISISDLPQPVLTRVPISNRIIPVPVAVAVEIPSQRAAEDQGSTTTESRELAKAERRIINGVHPKVDVSKPPVAIERFARFGGGWPANTPPQPGDLLVKASSAVRPAAATTGHLTDSLPTQPDLIESGPAAASLTHSDTDSVSLSAVAVPPEAAVAKAVTVVGRILLRPSEVRTVKLGGTVQKIESDMPATCTAFLTKGGQIQVIATGTGSAKLTVELTEAPNVTRKVAYEVQVAETATGAQSHDLIATRLNEAIRLAFPQANAQLRSHAGRLEIIGQCPDDETAKQILRMVRSACPVAINDRLTVR